MEKARKYIVIASIIIIVLLFVLGFLRRKAPKVEFDQNVKIEDVIKNDVEEKKVSGYHLVTYDISANSNSFLQNLQITASNDGSIRFVIGSLDENNFVQERIEFTLDCQKGNNDFDLLNKRYLVKQGEYLWMDLSGQDFVYEKQNSDVKSLVQTQSKKISGKMQVQESNYILPYEYTLQEIEQYNCLFLGNEITDNYTGIGYGATEEKLDYYNLTKSRLKDTFKNVNINRINITEWEKAEDVDKEGWIEQNLKQNDVKNLDLVILQFGDNFNTNSNTENSIKQLVEYIQKNSPNVEIMFISPWFNKNDVYRKLPSICDELGIIFIDISDLAKDDEYKTPREEDFIDDNGEVQKKVVYYPNNSAMQIISNRIIERLGFNIY